MAAEGNSPVDSRGPDEVIVALSDDDPSMREAAVRRASALGLPDPLLEAVIATAGDPDPRVRRAVAEALTGRTDPEALRALTSLLDDRAAQVTWVAEEAMWVLPELKERLARAISKMLREGRPPSTGGYRRFRGGEAPSTDASPEPGG
jgi:HEAT repeat protein